MLFDFWLCALGLHFAGMVISGNFTTLPIFFINAYNYQKMKKSA